MGTVTTWAAIVGAVIAGCLVAERMRSRTDAELIAARRRWLLVAVALLFIYMLGGREFYGFGIFGGSNGYWRTSALERIRLRGSFCSISGSVSERQHWC